MKFGSFTYGSKKYGPDWLIKRLSYVKRINSRWQQLAQSIQDFWMQLFDPEIKRAINLRSIYTADKDGQLQILKEFGGYFENDLPSANVAIATSQRKYEIHQKKTSIPFLKSLARACPEISVEWVPLYAPTFFPYGVKFFTAYEISPEWFTDSPWRLDGTWKVKNPNGVKIGIRTLKVDGTWKVGATPPIRLGYPCVYLTSRGMIAINWESITDPAWIDILRLRISQFKPVDTVFDGFLYRANYDLVVTLLGEATTLMNVRYVAFGSGGHNPDDGKALPENGSAMALTNELLRKELTNKSQDGTTITGVGRLEKYELSGKTISEIGLLDFEGNLLGLKNMAAMVLGSDEYFEVTMRLETGV